MRPDFYAISPDAPGPMAAHLDTVSDAGTVEGWAAYRDSLVVCHIQVRLGGVVLGEDMADKFRADLLRAGLRHGHCAFCIVIPITRPGAYPLELVDGRNGQRISHMGPQIPFVPQRVHTPDQALSQFIGATWTDEQLLTHSSCLQLDMNYERMGAAGFIDSVFRFALGRWADPAALDSYGIALRTASITPLGVFEAVLTSDERKRQSRKLPTPFDIDFPFEYELRKSTSSIASETPAS